MHKGKIGVLTLSVEDRCRTMLLEGVKHEDRPTVVGYFILDTLRSVYQTGVDPESPVTIKAGLIAPDVLQEAVDSAATHIWSPPVAGVDMLGDIYKLVLAVSRGEKRDL